jgi:hypothetical protein
MDRRIFDTRTLRIRELNDALRACFPYCDSSSEASVRFTNSIYALIRESGLFHYRLIEAVRTFNDFTDDNDPHGEHDMAFFICE